MQSAAGTFPLPFSESLEPFRTPEASALGTGLGSPSFIGLDIHCLPSGSLVPQHVPECAPAGIVDGLRHLRSCQSRRTHVSDNDQSVFFGNPRRLFVKVVPARIGNLRLNRACPLLSTSPLRTSKRGLMFAVVTQRRNLAAVAERRERLETEINPHITVSGREVVGDATLEADVPAPTCILGETSAEEFTIDLAVLPEAIYPLEVDSRVTVNAHGALDERYPADSALRSEAGPKTRALALGVAGRRELPTDGLNGVGVNAEISGGAGAELDQIECGRPAAHRSSAPSPLGFSLGGAAEVPDLIACDGMTVEMLSGRRVLDAKFEGQDTHFGSAAGYDSCRSRGRRALARSTASPFLSSTSKKFNFCSNSKERASSVG